MFTFGRKCEENEFQFPGFTMGRLPLYGRNEGNLPESYGT